MDGRLFVGGLSSVDLASHQDKLALPMIAVWRAPRPGLAGAP